MYTPEISADDIARALNGRRSGRSWIARCPAHDDRTPSLSITQGDDRVLVHCFSGCSWQAIFAALSSQGLWSGSGAAPEGRCPAVPPPRERDSGTADEDKAGRVAFALQLWSESASLTGTLGERYLVDHRRLDARHLRLGHALRWHPRIRAVVGLMTDAVTGEPVGVTPHLPGCRRRARSSGRCSATRA